MRYSLEQGPTEAKILDVARKTRQKIPKAIQNAPRLNQGLGFVWQAFHDLSTCRVPDGPIPWVAACTYADKYGIIDFDQFWQLIANLDGFWMDWHRGKLQSTTKQKGKGSSRKQ